MEFTYYGDLLGISALYKLSPKIAYEKLNSFYNTTFLTINETWQRDHDIQVILFSDSILMWGDDAKGALEQLSSVYIKLLQNGLLLRGAVVDRKIHFDPRITRENFQKLLPNDSTLARAVGLGNSHKGARLFVEAVLANQLLSDMPAWLTHDGYIRDINKYNCPPESILRRVCPTPEGSTYEVLYFWVSQDFTTFDIDVDFKGAKEKLQELSRMVQDQIGDHYKETIALLTRCEARQKYTEKQRVLIR